MPRRRFKREQQHWWTRQLQSARMSWICPTASATRSLVWTRDDAARDRGVRVLNACSSVSVLSAFAIERSGIRDPIAIHGFLAPATRHTANRGAAESLLVECGPIDRGPARRRAATCARLDGNARVRSASAPGPPDGDGRCVHAAARVSLTSRRGLLGGSEYARRRRIAGSHRARARSVADRRAARAVRHAPLRGFWAAAKASSRTRSKARRGERC